MKRATIGIVFLCAAFAAGCSKPQTVSLPPATGTNNIPVKPLPEPEVIISMMETPDERATYLRELAKDSKFDPKKHVPMLQKYSQDPTESVATPAKELLAKRSSQGVRQPDVRQIVRQKSGIPLGRPKT